ncbi:xanthine dehydrogenase family protein molybdopterin-binding subunit [Amycolatopsis pithecellobii]|uniref:Molybdopterin-dependent oxidoreductase n=1 Tax=Amycolatopsis pithecellobii TaxID=664692 RepID=A0A6N7YRY9_9PSEU|nr:xanthine dehydrogenase family protein molybdopterin-binding subunit [Amycolatopsis pithecellobii]MTD54698.1 molybdopterin-dependent oxidoreductase [Amycolatopsis pithecellobii]
MDLQQSSSTETDVSAEWGDRPRRQHGDRVLTGRAEYVDDVVLPGMLHAALVRSPHPHARIVSIDTAGAEAIPGVQVVLTGERAAELAKPVPHFMDPALMGCNSAEFPVLALDKVRWVGEPVAAVAADSLATAEAAASAIVVDYAPLPAVFDVEAALRPDAPRVFEHWPDNVIGHLPNAQGNPDTAIRAARHRGSTRITVGRHQAAPMENRGYVGSWITPDRIELWASTQNPHILRTRLSDVLGVSEERVRVAGMRMGGAFGQKFVGYPEEVLVCVLSRLAQAPVKWLESRSEALLAGAREFTHDVEFGFDDSGVLLGLKVRMLGNVGCLASWSGWGLTAMGGFTFPGPYRCADYEVDGVAVVTNKAPWAGARGYGKEQAAIVLERVMDLIGAELGLDPATVRFRNFQPPDGIPGWVHNKHIDSADYAGVLTKVLDLAGYAELRDRQREARQQGRLAGIGVGFELCPEGGELIGTLTRGHDSATVRVHPSGAVTVLAGVTNPGTGNETTIAYLVAREFGIDIRRVEVVQGDTDRCPYGFGSFGSRAATSSAAAAAAAAREIRGHLAVAAADRLACPADEIEFAGGFVHSATKSMSFAEIAEFIFKNGSTATGINHAQLEVTKLEGPHNFQHQPDAQGRTNFYPAYPCTAVIAVVGVDRDTGVVTLEECYAVGDCGVILNRNFVDSQLLGALSQGVGGVLWEDLPYDGEGNPLARTLKSYLLPRSTDLPAFRVDHQETPSPFTMFGSKGAGESGLGVAMAAVTNAVNDAVAPFGAELHSLPLSPPRVLSAIEGVSLA